MELDEALSVAEADHYSHISQWNNTLVVKGLPQRFWIIPCTMIWVCYHSYGVFFFAHSLILEYPDHHQNLISSSLYYPEPFHNVSSQSGVYNFLRNVAHRQTDKSTLPKT